MPARMRASDLSPMPGRLWSLPALAAASSSARLVTPSCFQKRATFLGPRSGTCKRSTRVGGHLGFQLVQELQVAGGEQLVDLFGDGLADAGDLGELAVLPEGAGVDAEVLEAVGGLAVGEDLVDHLAFDLEQVGDLLEDGGQLVVGVRSVGHWLNDTMSGGRRQPGGWARGGTFGKKIFVFFAKRIRAYHRDPEYTEKILVKNRYGGW